MSIIGNMLGIENTQNKNVLLKNPWWYWQNTPPWIAGLMNLGLMTECHKCVALWRHRAYFHCRFEWRWHLLARILTLRCYDTRTILIPREKIHSVSEWALVCVCACMCGCVFHGFLPRLKKNACKDVPPLIWCNFIPHVWMLKLSTNYL